MTNIMLLMISKDIECNQFWLLSQFYFFRFACAFSCRSVNVFVFVELMEYFNVAHRISSVSRHKFECMATTHTTKEWKTIKQNQKKRSTNPLNQFEIDSFSLHNFRQPHFLSIYHSRRFVMHSIVFWLLFYAIGNRIRRIEKIIIITTTTLFECRNVPWYLPPSTHIIVSICLLLSIFFARFCFRLDFRWSRRKRLCHCVLPIRIYTQI